MNHNANFNSAEIELLLNQGMIEEKLLVLKKITELLQQLGFEAEKQLPVFLNSKRAKVSKGENLKGFPFRVLDYPRIFTEKDVFAFRTLFWWGNCITFTLHLKGSFLTDNYRKLEKLTGQYAKTLYLSKSGDEWSNNVSENNFSTLGSDSFNKISFHEIPFLKIVQQNPISQINNLSESYHEFLNCLITPLCIDVKI